ncbi:MAG: zinc ribbon domain-containing protein [Candidatus Hadarchaeum sp.]|uniref:zinc ribbon domain-containing protein n=1 Tax=Candidatus Hadarchaeum sp. TaxID=2883567 RepID=UPI003D1190CA
MDPKGTSQTCASCGASVPKPLSERLHVCPSCGHRAHRDVNAVQVVLHRARSGLCGGAGGAPASAVPARSWRLWPSVAHHEFNHVIFCSALPRTFAITDCSSVKL